jgi:hypothetical protein
MKLRKLTDSHYIITSDDNILEGDFVINNLDKLIGRSIRPISIAEVNDKEYSKITHSTQPLEYIHIAPKVKGLKLGFKNIKQLSLSEVEEVINGYSVEKMAEKFVMEKLKISSQAPGVMIGYIEGFKTHQELVKDKLFTIEDIQLAFAKGIQYTTKPYPQNVQFENEFKQSLLPKTEWDIEINEQNKITLL